MDTTGPVRSAAADVAGTNPDPMAGLSAAIDAALSGVLPSDPAADYARQHVTDMAARMIGEALAEAVYVRAVLATVERCSPANQAAVAEDVATLDAASRYQVWVLVKGVERFGQMVGNGKDVRLFTAIMERCPEFAPLLNHPPTIEAVSAILRAEGSGPAPTVEMIAGKLVEGFARIRYAGKE